MRTSITLGILSFAAVITAAAAGVRSMPVPPVYLERQADAPGVVQGQLDWRGALLSCRRARSAGRHRRSWPRASAPAERCRGDRPASRASAARAALRGAEHGASRGEDHPDHRRDLGGPMAIRSSSWLRRGPDADLGGLAGSAAARGRGQAAGRCSPKPLLRLDQHADPQGARGGRRWSALLGVSRHRRGRQGGSVGGRDHRGEGRG